MHEVMELEAWTAAASLVLFQTQRLQPCGFLDANDENV